MNIRIILSFIAFTFMFGAFGQNNSAIDSLESILKTAKADTTKVNCLNALSKQYRIMSEYKMAMQYAESALSLAKTLDYRKGIADSYNKIGNVKKHQGNYPETLKNYCACLKIREEIGDKKGSASAYFWIGTIYEYQSNYPEALKNYCASLKIIFQSFRIIALFVVNITNIVIRTSNAVLIPDFLENFQGSQIVFQSFRITALLLIYNTNIVVSYGNTVLSPDFLFDLQGR